MRRDVSLIALFILLDVHVDAMDVAGDNQMQVEHNMLKQRLSSQGERIG